MFNHRGNLIACGIGSWCGATAFGLLGVLFLSSQLIRPEAQAAARKIGSPGSPARETKKQIRQAIEGQRVYFTENQGQTDWRVAYYYRGENMAAYFTPRGITFTWAAASESPHSQNQKLAIDEFSAPLREAVKRRWALKLDFLAAKAVSPIAKEQTATVVNYLRGPASRWRTSLRTYSTLVYENLWPGVDLVYGGSGKHLKYSFVVRPGADPSQIRLAYRGASAIRVNGAGRLEVVTPAGRFYDERPVAYQEMGGRRTDVDTAYALDTAAAASSRGYHFQLGAYDRNQPLVIDPVVIALRYSGFLGGGFGDSGSDIAIDASGSAYVTGSTASINFPGTAGAYQTSSGGASDVFVAKISANFSTLVYSTYLGGSGSDGIFGGGITVDANGNAFVTGSTDSTDFPTTVGAYRRTNGGGFDAFVTKISSDGATLLYSTYLGGSSSEFCQGIAVDAQGNAYVTGRTHSLNFPTTPGAFQTALQGSSDVFVTKVDATGSSLVYSTYLGGSGSGFEHGRGIAVDASGNAYVTGLTESPTFPTTPGAFRTSSSGSGEAFVTKMSTDGSGLVYSTYLGGGGYDEAFRIALDGAGNAYVTGETQSVNFPITPGAVQTVLRSAPDVFVTKVNSGGSALVYSTYLGGSNLDFGFGVAVDSGGNAYVTGLSYSNDFPATAGAFQRENHGSADAFAAEIDSSGSVLVFATYLGGRNYEEGHGIAVDKNGNSYLTGITYSANFPVRGGPDLKYNDSGDAFAAKIVK